MNLETILLCFAINKINIRMVRDLPSGGIMITVSRSKSMSLSRGGATAYSVFDFNYMIEHNYLLNRDAKILVRAFCEIYDELDRQGRLVVMIDPKTGAI